ncbi:protein-export chaperone SecB [Bacteroides thetaiotaomicron]|uniref:protein-export chaperone SecB n=1 Tax=Bacteroides thetaiotaomicron TaxID=818 RepID=UPI0039C8BC4A
MKQAAFSLKDYSIVKATLNLEKVPNECTFDLSFDPSGVFIQEDKLYILTLIFKASYKNNKQKIEVVNIKLKAIFQFKDFLEIDDMPPYFYSNSIAIIFPYIRAFVSTITLQSNVTPIMIPTLNISSLEYKLKENTSVK